jgi:sortase A
MRLARVLGAIGRALISAGVIVLLFVAYQLWGTGLQHQAAQGSLEDDFLELLDSSLADEAEQVEATFTTTETEPATADAPAATESTEGDGDAVDATPETAEEAAAAPAAPAPEDVEYSPQLLEALYPEPGDSLARIVIPAINVDQITVAGVSVEDLRKGPGHYSSTPNPGQAGNSAIAGHRTTYGAPFHRIDELNPGDEIIVQTIQGTFTYLVRENIAPDGSTKGHFIVSPSDTWVLGQESGENLLTLTACHPKYSARQRIIVQAELVGEPAPTIPRGEDVDFAPVELDAGAEDEARGTEVADAPGEDIAQVMSDEVAADDDPSVDAEGNPIDGDDETGDEAAADATAADDAASDGAAEVAESADDVDAMVDESEATGVIDESEATGSSDDVELTSAQTPFTDDDFGEGLNGDPTKIRPAVMWGLAGGAIWLAAWFIGQRLNRKWTLYLIGLVPFAPALWSCFVNIDQALPSY